MFRDELGCVGIDRDDIPGVVSGKLWMCRFSRPGNLWVFGVDTF